MCEGIFFNNKMVCICEANNKSVPWVRDDYTEHQINTDQWEISCRTSSGLNELLKHKSVGVFEC